MTWPGDFSWSLSFFLCETQNLTIPILQWRGGLRAEGTVVVSQSPREGPGLQPWRPCRSPGVRIIKSCQLCLKPPLPEKNLLFPLADGQSQAQSQGLVQALS